VSGDNNTDHKLDPDETWIFEATGTAAPGQYSNMGNVTGKSPINQTVTDEDPSHYFGQKPGISIITMTNLTDNDSPPGLFVPVGDAVTWTYTVNNTGNVNLSNVKVVDDKGVIVTYVSGDTNGDGYLNLTETWIFQAAGTATAGQYTNLGSVTGTPPVGPDVSDSNPDNYFGQKPGISMVKTTNSTDNDLPPGMFVPVGDTVTWTYTVTWKYNVTNTGNVNLTNVTVRDDQLGVIGTISLLLPGQSQTLTETGSALAGQYENMGNVTGEPPVGPDANDEDPSHYFGQAPGIALVKTTNGQDSNSPPGPYIPEGDTVTWTYNVTNTGNVNLSNITVIDDVLGLVGTIPSLLPGESITLTSTGPASKGQYSNLSNASGTPPVGPDVSDEDPSHYFGQAPGIALVKTTNGQDANTPTGPIIPVGGTVTWKYNVTNTGNVNLKTSR
jgi:large repetitive protein